MIRSAAGQRSQGGYDRPSLGIATDRRAGIGGQSFICHSVGKNRVGTRGYAELRRQVFCLEQRLFVESDRDEHDPAACPIVAIGSEVDGTTSVVGTVRIYETDAGNWFGSRLAVASCWRGMPGLSAGLIRKAVCTAHALGCRTFLANVQPQNVPLFRRLHWKTVGSSRICDVVHHLMQADLAYYPKDPGGPFQ